MNRTYLKIADFNILITKNESYNVKNYNHLVSHLKFYLAGFIQKRKPKKIDFEIEINDLIAGKLTKKNNPLLTFFPKNEKNKVVTTYKTEYFNFQLILQNILYKLLSDNKGFFIHASASNINGEAYLFTGMSGAGKSTIVKLLSAKFKPLSDDLSIIRKINGKFLYFQHPILEKNFIKGKTPKPYPIGKICFLKKSKDFKLELIKNKELVFKKLAKQLRSPDIKNTKAFMNFLSINNTHYLLSFSKDKNKLAQLINLSNSLKKY